MGLSLLFMNILIVKRQIPGRADLQLALVGSAKRFRWPARHPLSAWGLFMRPRWGSTMVPPFLLEWGPQDLKGITCRLNVTSGK